LLKLKARMAGTNSRKLRGKKIKTGLIRKYF
jgi:hypothetical protein